MNKFNERIEVFSAAGTSASQECKSISEKLSAHGLNPVCVIEAATSSYESRVSIQVPVAEANSAKSVLAQVSLANEDLVTVHHVPASTEPDDGLSVVALLEAGGIEAFVVAGEGERPEDSIDIRVATDDARVARSIIEANAREQQVRENMAQAAPPFGTIPQPSIPPILPPESTTVPVSVSKSSGPVPAAGRVRFNAPRKGSPWTASACGWLAVFFGPLAGALIAFVSLRRMGHRKAAWGALFFAPLVWFVVLAIVSAICEFVLHWTTPRFLALVGSRHLFGGWIESEVATWESENPGRKTAGWWTALPLAILGMILLAVPIFILLLVAGIIDSDPFSVP